MKYWEYLKYLLRHKFYVMIECFKEGMIIEGLLHDLSKFSILEFRAYANHFCGENKEKYKIISQNNGYSKDDDPVDDPAFDEAWLHHIHHNPHHWQYWVMKENGFDEIVLEMPRRYMIEMVCDWIGAGKAQGRLYKDELIVWYNTHKDKIILAPYTRKLVETKIKYY